jgi:hypothetical protein
MTYSYTGSSEESAIQAVTALYLCQAHISVFLLSKEADSRIFGPKRDEVTGEWRKLHDEELHDLYCSPTTG